MKNIILSILMSCFCFGLSAQEYKVSTEVQPKNVLLEEFTGMRCGHCPEGHRKAQELKLIFGDRLSVVAIHCGYFASAGAYEPDFVVDDGLEIGNFLGGSYGSFPSAAVNRRDWWSDNTYSYARSLWLSFSRQVSEEKAPVNLWAEAQIDAKTREMKIRVEGYFTEDVTGELPRLSILLTQNNVLGLQYGGGMGNQYPHQHMLRDAITAALGDELSAHAKGEYFVKEYTYQVPEKIKEIAVNPAELELVVLVTHGKANVLNTLNVLPGYVGEDLPLSAEIASHKIAVSGGYRYNFVPVMLKNKSNVPLTSARFDITLNDVTTESEWQGEVAPFTTKEIHVPVDWGTTAGSNNTFHVALKGLNGEAYWADGFYGSFGAPITLPAHITLRISTDDEAVDNTYTLYDMEGKVVKAFGPFENGVLATHEEKLDLEPGKTYCLEVTDSWGNGVFAWGNALEIANEEGTILWQQTDILGFGMRLFFQTNAETGVDKVELDKEREGNVYNTAGQYVGTTRNLHQLGRGVYIIRSDKGNKKIFIH